MRSSRSLDDPSVQGHGIATDRKAFTVAAGPCRTDGRPEGVLAFAVKAVGGFVDRGG